MTHAISARQVDLNSVRVEVYPCVIVDQRPATVRNFPGGGHRRFEVTDPSVFTVEPRQFLRDGRRIVSLVGRRQPNGSSRLLVMLAPARNFTDSERAEAIPIADLIIELDASWRLLLSSTSLIHALQKGEAASCGAVDGPSSTLRESSSMSGTAPLPQSGGSGLKVADLKVTIAVSTEGHGYELRVEQILDGIPVQIIKTEYQNVLEGIVHAVAAVQVRIPSGVKTRFLLEGSPQKDVSAAAEILRVYYPTATVEIATTPTACEGLDSWLGPSRAQDANAVKAAESSINALLEKASAVISALAGVKGGALKAANGLRSACDAALHGLVQKPRVAFVGRTRHGKSTLLNALIGDEVLPTDVEDCTGSIIRMTSGTRFEAQIKWLPLTKLRKELKDLEEEARDLKSERYALLSPEQNSKRLQRIERNRAEQAALRVLLKNYEANETTTTGLASRLENLWFAVEEIEIRHPAPLLDIIDIVDTPGLTSGDERRQRAALAALQSAEMFLFVHSAAEDAADDVTRKLIGQAIGANPNVMCAGFVLTRLDAANDVERTLNARLGEIKQLHVSGVREGRSSTAWTAILQHNKPDEETLGSWLWKSRFLTARPAFDDKLHRLLQRLDGAPSTDLREAARNTKQVFGLLADALHVFRQHQASDALRACASSKVALERELEGIQKECRDKLGRRKKLDLLRLRRELQGMLHEALEKTIDDAKGKADDTAETVKGTLAKDAEELEAKTIKSVRKQFNTQVDVGIFTLQRWMGTRVVKTHKDFEAPLHAMILTRLNAACGDAIPPAKVFCRGWAAEVLNGKASACWEDPSVKSLISQHGVEAARDELQSVLKVELETCPLGLVGVKGAFEWAVKNDRCPDDVSEAIRHGQAALEGAVGRGKFWDGTDVQVDLEQGLLTSNDTAIAELESKVRQHCGSQFVTMVEANAIDHCFRPGIKEGFEELDGLRAKLKSDLAETGKLIDAESEASGEAWKAVEVELDQATRALALLASP